MNWNGWGRYFLLRLSCLYLFGGNRERENEEEEEEEEEGEEGGLWGSKQPPPAHSSCARTNNPFCMPRALIGLVVGSWRNNVDARFQFCALPPV